MRDTMKRAIDLLFQSLPFSRKNELCKETLMSSAIQKYEEDQEQGIHPVESAGNFLIHSNSVENISSYLGIGTPQYVSEKEIEILDKSAFQKVEKKLRRNNCLISLLIAFCFNFVFALVLNLSFMSCCFAAAGWLFFGSMLYLTLKSRKNIVRQNNYFASAYDYTCREIAENKYDLYTKKLTNTLFGFISIIFILLFSVLLSFTSYRYSLTEVANTVNFYLFFIFLAVYLTLKNYACRKTYSNFFCRRISTEYLCEMRRIGLFSTGYYLFFLGLLIFLRNKTDLIFSMALVVVGVYFILVIFYNCTRRRNFISKNIVFNLRKVTCYTLILACLLAYNFMKLDLYLIQPYINKVSSVGHVSNDILYDEDNGVYTIVSDKDDFKILQLTDIHLGGSVLSIREDTKALKACYRLIQETTPDFVVVTGDLVFPMGIMSFSFNNNAPVMQFANYTRNTGIPWAFTYGNHDTEFLATLSRAEVDELLQSLSYKTSKNLLYPYIQPDVYGRSNQLIEIRNQDGGLRQALFLIDSNDYIETGGLNEYDYIHEDQVEWYQRTVQRLSRQEGHTIPSMIFTHIPLREYKEANDLYESGSKDVTYHYGMLGEKMIDKICCSQYDSKLFDTAVDLGSTKAIFFGHDHYNNQSLEYKGIRMTYGYSIDYLAMPGIENDTEQRGATLITIEKDGAFDITPYRLMDLK